MTEPLYAAVDCGTNSTRLLISDGRSQIERHMRVTRLGAGVDRTGRLDPEAIERRVEASDTCAARLRAAGVQLEGYNMAEAANDIRDLVDVLDKWEVGRLARAAGVAVPEASTDLTTDRFPVVVKGRLGAGGRAVPRPLRRRRRAPRRPRLRGVGHPAARVVRGAPARRPGRPPARSSRGGGG